MINIMKFIKEKVITKNKTINGQNKESELVQLFQFHDQLDIYNQLIFFYGSGLKQLQTKLEILSNEYKYSNKRNPIESIKGRIKSLDSIVNKMDRKNLEPTLENLLYKIHDIAGIRIVCPFVSDVYNVESFLKNQKDIHILQIKDYIKEPKPNGYRTLHIILTIDTSFSDTTISIPVEVQIRTIAMNSWASLEHQLHYKKDYPFTNEMLYTLKECSDLSWENDKKMQKLLHMIKQ